MIRRTRNQLPLVVRLGGFESGLSRRGARWLYSKKTGESRFHRPVARRKLTP